MGQLLNALQFYIMKFQLKLNFEMKLGAFNQSTAFETEHLPRKRNPKGARFAGPQSPVPSAQYPVSLDYRAAIGNGNRIKPRSYKRGPVDTHTPIALRRG